MENLLREDPMAKAQQPSHLSLADEVSEKAINEFGSKEQKEMIDAMYKNIKNDYQMKIDEAEKLLASLKTQYDNFLGNPPQSEHN